MLKRELNLPRTQHFFLIGPRQVGKTTLIKESFAEEDRQIYNLLLSDLYSKYKAEPELFRQEVFAISKKISWIVIDEVQRIPEILNEVQFLIDRGIDQKFIITGSSARKIKRGRGNLLGGRAWALNLFPLSFQEMGSLNKLTDILTYGSLPHIVTSNSDIERQEFLRSYVEVYLKEEIELEALSRNIGGFIRFLSIAAQSNGEQLNFTNIAKDVGISSVTAKEYFKILEDTLLGFFLLPFDLSERKKHKTSPKFYFFDTGVLRATQKKLSLAITSNTFEFGNYFETWIINECMKISSYLRKDLSFSFLRTTADVEVDLIIQCPSGQILAVEIKSKKTPDKRDFESGFLAIKSLVPKAECICVCTGESQRAVNGYKVMHYSDFFELLRSC